METQDKKLRKYSALSLGIVLVTAFVLVQPTMQASYADNQGGVISSTLGAEGIPSYDDCDLIDWERHIQTEFDFDDEEQAEDSISMETVRNGNKVLTVHVEKEKYSCELDQGEINVLLDVDIYLQVLENIETQEILNTAALATSCMKSEDTAQTIACESYTVPTTPVFVGSFCDNIEEEEDSDDLTQHPQEMNIVKKGSTVKTIVAQKEIFMCGLEPLVGGDECDECDTWKKVDVVLFTDVYKDINTLEDTAKFYEYRCVTLVTNDDNDDDEEDDDRDATVESCIFRQVPT